MAGIAYRERLADCGRTYDWVLSPDQDREDYVHRDDWEPSLSGECPGHGEALAARTRVSPRSRFGRRRRRVSTAHGPHFDDALGMLDLPLSHLRDCLKKSTQLLGLANGWDGEDGRPISKLTWRRAVEFVIGQAQSHWLASSRRMDPPDLTPVPDGSIDVHWDYTNYELLVNIPSGTATIASFYGDNRRSTKIEGEFDLSSPLPGLALWLTR